MSRFVSIACPMCFTFNGGCSVICPYHLALYPCHRSLDRGWYQLAYIFSAVLHIGIKLLLSTCLSTSLSISIYLCICLKFVSVYTVYIQLSLYLCLKSVSVFLSTNICISVCKFCIYLCPPVSICPHESN